MRRSAALASVVVLVTLLGSCDGGPTGPDEGLVELTVTGLPMGATASISVTSTEGVTRAVAADGTPTALPSGRYTVVVNAVEFAEDVFNAPAPAELRVRRGKTAALSVAYGLASGSIAFDATGLPDGAQGTVTLSGPSGATRNGVVPGIVRGLLAGNWTVTSTSSLVDGHRYEAAGLAPISISASTTPVNAALAYSLATGALQVTFGGLPMGVAPTAVLYGPGGRIADLSSDTLLVGLTPGAYTLSPENSFDRDVRYLAPLAQGEVFASLTPTALGSTYTPRSGRIAFTVTGLPGDVVPRVRVRGPDGYDVMADARDTLRAVPNGTYQLEGALVGNADGAYGTDALADVVVTGATTSAVALEFAPTVAFDATVTTAFLVQSVQDSVGGVPLVSNRDALLRVFPTASHPNALQAPLRVRLLQGMSSVLDVVIPPVGDGIPQEVLLGALDRSWNLPVDGALLQPGTTLELTLDPDATLPELDRANNVWQQPLDVRGLDAFRARFIPIQFSQTGQTGNITPENAETFLRPTRDMLPVGDIDYDFRAPLVTAEAPLTTSNQATWSNILGALRTVQVAEGSGRYYMGIIPVTYSSGIAGIGYVPGYATLTWDYLPSGGGTLAHELGHNLFRRHAPCGNPAGVDAEYPYPDADIGQYGYNTRLGSLVDPASKDLMSYCSDEWISDYTFKAMLAHREMTEATSTGAVEDVILVSGRIQQGAVTLEPTYALRTRPVLPSAGPHRLRLQDAAGRTVYETSFAGLPVSHLDDEQEHFVFAIPRRLLGGGELAGLRVEARGAVAEWRVPAQPALRTAASAVAERLTDGRVEVRWTDPAVQGLMIRDAATGTVISIVRGSSITLPPTDAVLDVLASDGIRTTVDRVRPAPR